MKFKALAVWGSLLLPVLAQAQFTYTTNNGGVTITGYTGSGGDVAIPATTNNLPVVSIGYQAFWNCTNLTSVLIPDSVTSLGMYAFFGCPNLTSIALPTSLGGIPDCCFSGCTGLRSVSISEGVGYIGWLAFASCTNLTNIIFPSSITNLWTDAFSGCRNLRTLFFKGNAPQATMWTFAGANDATVYYLLGTTGWGPTLGDGPALPTLLWNPQAQTCDPSFGIRGNQFGFNISGTTNIPVVVEACTNLANPVWSPVATNVLAAGSFYFSDPQWTNYPTRLYRLRWP